MADTTEPIVLAGRYEIDSSLGRGWMSEIYLGHPSSAERRVDLVTPGEHDRLSGVSHAPSPYPLNAASSTARAIGAATWPPVASLPRLPPPRTTTATTIFGFCAGAKHTNQA